MKKSPKVTQITVSVLAVLAAIAYWQFCWSVGGEALEPYAPLALSGGALSVVLTATGLVGVAGGLGVL